MAATPLRALRTQALARSLAPAGSLLDAVVRLGFVQLDPIRAPARAADLILRHRLADYRAGDLGRAYPALPLAEDYVHVYGVLPRSAQQLLHPRRISSRWQVEREHPRLSARILDHVAQHGETHPRDLVPLLGRARTASGWGGESAATTRTLEALHRRGRLRVARRVDGIKVYDVAMPALSPLAPDVRARGIVAMLFELYAPMPEASLRQLARMVTESSLSPARRARALAAHCADPSVERVLVDGICWLVPARGPELADVDDRVRLLAPFDPVVWDRGRFAAFWGWEYRLEAYTPPGRRRFGYYALPLLWRDDVVGWVNAAIRGDVLVAEAGFAKAAPASKTFSRELDAELERLRRCVGAARFERIVPAHGRAGTPRPA